VGLSVVLFIENVNKFKQRISITYLRVSTVI